MLPEAPVFAIVPPVIVVVGRATLSTVRVPSVAVTFDDVIVPPVLVIVPGPVVEFRYSA